MGLEDDWWFRGLSSDSAVGLGRLSRHATEKEQGEEEAEPAEPGLREFQKQGVHPDPREDLESRSPNLGPELRKGAL